MKAVWAYGNNDWTKSFKFSKLELITVFASITLWKKFYPEVPTYLYCDESVKKYLTEVDLLQFWDNVDTSIHQTQDIYNRKAFWTIDKIRLFQHLETPFTFMDMDFYIKKRLSDYTNYDYVCAFAENTKNYYPPYYDKTFKELNFPKEFTFKDTAHNTCFFYVRNSDVAKKYTDMCLSYMKQINDKELTQGHSVFLEQTILYELALVNNWNWNLLMNQKFNDVTGKCDPEIIEGFLSPKQTEEYYRHLSVEKMYATEGTNKFLIIKGEIIGLTKQHNPELLPLLHKLCQ
jgi:hypothetical protein